MAIYWRNGWAWARKTIKGQEYREPLKTRSKREAESAYGRWLTSLEAEQNVASKKSFAFSKAVELFTEEHLNRLKKKSQVRYLQSLMTLADHFDGKTLQNIGKEDLAKFVSARKKTGVEDATVLRDLACLSSVFTIVSDFDKVDTNPVLSYVRTQKRRKVLRESDPRERYLSHAEELAILRHAIDIAFAPKVTRRDEKWMIARALCLYLDTGLRGQELLNMQWSWVDLAACEIRVPKDFTKSKKDRVVPLLPRAVRVLTRIPRHSDVHLVFWRCNAGKRFKDLNHTFQRYAAAVGVRDIHVHDLRRTFGCRMLQDKRATMAEVSQLLGHASIAMTERAYAFLKVENLHTAMGTARAREDLRPHLEAVMDVAQVDISDQSGTIDGTPQNKVIETAKKNRLRRLNHNP